MTDLWLVIAPLLAVIVGSELALRGTKLQTGLGRVVLVWAGVFVVSVGLLARGSHASPLAFTIFWSGAFLSWFGVRSHIESSILLRMLYLLRQQPMTEARLLAEYGSRYSEMMRINELLRGGLAVKTGEHLKVTPKGKTILRIVSGLR